MKKTLKTLAFAAAATLVGASAFADGLLADSGEFVIGGASYDCTSWSTSGGADSTDLGYLSELTVSGIRFDFWSDNSHNGANMYFQLWDKDGTYLGGLTDGDGLWLGDSTYIGGDWNHDYRISWSGTLDGSFGNSLTTGKEYYLDVWFKTYGGNDVWYPGNSGKYHTKFIYGKPQTFVYNLNGGDSCDVMELTLLVGTTYDGAVQAVWADHVFKGWWTDPEGGNRYQNGISIVPDLDEPLTLYAHWADAQIVHFDANGGTCNPESVINSVGGPYWRFPTPTRENYVFRGWYDENAGGVRIKNGDSPVTTDKDRYLTAHWDGGPQQIVYFQANDGECDTPSVSCTKGKSYSKFPTPTRAGYVFRGWYDENAGNVRVKNGDSPVTDADSRTLTAHWEGPRQTIYFRPDGGDCAKEFVTCTQGGTYGGFPKPTKENYVFRGWFADDEDGARVKNGDSPVTADLERTLYAHWRAIPAALVAARAARDTTANYELISSVAALEEGSYVILTDEDSGYALPASCPGTYFDRVQVTPVNDVISTANASIVWKVKKDASGNIAFYNEGVEQYAGHNGGGNSNSGRLQDDPFYHTVALDANGVASVTSATADGAGNYRSLQYNSGNTRFAYYKQTQADLRIYAKVADPTPTTDPTVTIAASADVVHVGDPAVTITATTANFPDGVQVGFIWWVNDEEDEETSDTLTLSTSVADTYEVNVWAYTGDREDPDELAEPTAPLTITVKEKVAGFEKITSIDDLTAGEYVITGAKAVGEEYAMMASIGGTSTKPIINRRDTAVTLDDDIVTDADASIIWTLEEYNGGWTIYNEAVGFACYKTSGNYAEAESTRSANSTWNITYDTAENVFVLANGSDNTRKLQYNTGSPRFACYTGSQKNLNLYKKVEEVKMQTFNYDLNGGDSCEVMTLTLPVGSTYDGAVQAVWADHVFKGWWTDPEGGDRYQNGISIVPDLGEPLTLYAHWADAQIVHFDANGGTCNPESVINSVGGPYWRFPTPTRENYVFRGWYDENAGGVRVKNGDSPVTTDKDRYLTAHWDGGPQQIVYFQANDGECDTPSVSCTKGKSYSKFPTPTRAGYVFRGWYDENAGNVRVKNGDSPVTEADTRTLTAHWEGPRQTIYFRPDGGDCAKESVTCTQGGTYGGFPKPTKENYVFRGWFADDEDGARVKNGDFPVTDDLERTLYAHWRATASALSIFAFDMSPRVAAPAARSADSASVECTLWFTTVAGSVYEVLWTADLNGEWTVLKRWTADEDGDSPVSVFVPAGASTGFFRLSEVTAD